MQFGTRFVDGIFWHGAQVLHFELTVGIIFRRMAGARERKNGEEDVPAKCEGGDQQHAVDALIPLHCVLVHLAAKVQAFYGSLAASLSLSFAT